MSASTRAGALFTSVALGLLLAPSLLGFAASQSLLADDASALRSFVEAFAIREHFSGTILVHRRTEELFRGSFGLADRTWTVPATDRTRTASLR